MRAFPRGLAITIRSVIAMHTCLVLAGKDISTLDPTILTGDNFRGNAMLIRTIGMSSM